MRLYLGRLINFLVLFSALSFSVPVLAKDAAFKIGDKTTYVGDLYKEDEGAFYKLEKQKFDLIEQMARDKYLDYYWQEKAKKDGKSVKEVMDKYFDSNVKVSSKEVSETLDRYKEHPQLKKLPKAEQEIQIKDFLSERQKAELIEGIIASARSKKELVVLYTEPKEPIFKVSINKSDNVRYGPEPGDTKPMGCSDNCAVTVVEYSEFQCPFCSRVLPAVKRLLTEYKGKVRWAVRDFPLSFHDRAQPAAIAAHCAANQGKYWHMYSALFDNQGALGDADLKRYAEGIKGLDTKKWSECVANPKDVMPKIEENLKTGAKFGVTGTPAYFINGRRLSGALPYEDFKRVFDEELSKSRS